jgi:hypothetical protein
VESIDGPSSNGSDVEPVQHFAVTVGAPNRSPARRELAGT